MFETSPQVGSMKIPFSRSIYKYFRVLLGPQAAYPTLNLAFDLAPDANRHFPWLKSCNLHSFLSDLLVQPTPINRCAEVLK